MKAYFPSTVAFYEEMCVFCFLFFFKKRVRKVRETEKPEVPLWFGEGLRRSLVKAVGCHGRQSLVTDGHRALQACPLHGCSCLWKSSSEPSPDV